MPSWVRIPSAQPKKKKGGKMENCLLPTLDNVFIEFRCPKCLEHSTMTVSDLMNAGIEGPPYCDCTKDNVFLGVADTYIDRKD